ncbi:MAG: alkaline phosphatase family protein [Oscillospiraceae bacterium]|nr:alkaline phosphatase family protein [Oscillospiraceae bacterium]
MKQKLIVLSMDAMIFEDIAYMRTKPNFRKLFGKCAQINHVRTIFPAITYPCHTTLITGCNPGKHGVYNNVPFKDYEDKKKHWYLDAKVIRVEDLFAAAKRAGCTTASVYWPICGNNPNIDHIINEYFFFYPEDPIDAFSRMGASREALAIVEKNCAEIRHYLQTGERRSGMCDRFAMDCVCDMIRDVQPDVMLIHNSNPDTARHLGGVFGKEVYESLDRTDAWLGDMIRALEEAGTYDDTNFVLLSDHGQHDYDRRIRLNVLLAQGGFLDVAPDGGVYDWQAYAQSNGMSASVYLRDSGNTALYEKVYAYLLELKNSGKYGFTQVYKTEEVKEKYGTYGPFCFMVATDGKTSISEAWTKDAIEELGADEQKPRCATHGHEPDLGHDPIFIARGPGFREGAVIERAELRDVAPTLAGLWGESLPQAEGQCLRALLK